MRVTAGITGCLLLCFAGQSSARWWSSFAVETPSHRISAEGQGWQHDVIESALRLEDSKAALQLLVRSATSHQQAHGIEEPAIMVTIANEEGVRELLPLFVETMTRTSPVLASSTVVIAVSKAAFLECMRHRLLCFHDKEAEERNEKLAAAASDANLPRNKTPLFLQIGWDKLQRLQDALEVNTTILFADTDIAWLKDPLPYLVKSAADLQLTHDGWGPNIGVMYVRPTACTRLFMESWLARRTAPDARDQYELPHAVKMAEQKCPSFRVEHLEKSDFPNGCCCGSSFPQSREEGGRWVMWHAACGGDLSSKTAHLQKILHEAGQRAQRPDSI